VTQPGSLANLVPRSPRDLVARIEAIERWIRERSAVSGALQSPDFDGSLNPPAAGTKGWGLGGPGGAAVFNILVLRQGIVGDSALANPAAFGWANSDWDTLTFTTTNLEKTVTIPVPSGYTRALIMATAVSGATAYASGVANLYVSCSIQGVHPEFVAHQLAANLAGSASRSYAASLTSLTPGGTVSVGALGVIDTNGSVVASSCNLHVSAIAVFLR
jgi:hypothetical protein